MTFHRFAPVMTTRPQGPRPSHAVFTLALGLALAGCGASEQPEDATPDAPASTAFVPPLDSDILVAELHWEASGPPGVGRPTNLTRRPDYDNQPHFTPDGSGLWYTANDPQSGQADIWRYDFGSERVTRVTQSAPESEYSATPLPDGSGISTIRVEADSTQRLWRFDPDGSNGAVVFEEIAPVGYHAWVDDYTVVMFVLGSPPTLQRGDVRTGRATTITADITRSIHRIPNTFDASFQQVHEDGSSTIMRLPGDGGAPTPIIDALDGSQDHAWGPDGTLFQAQGSVLYAATPRPGSSMPGPDATWVSIADFTDLRLVLTRLAVSPDGSQIALVAELAAIDPITGN